MENQICTQVYGGGVVCGAHTTVNAGIAENLLLVGSLLLVSALVLAVFSKRLKATN